MIEPAHARYRTQLRALHADQALAAAASAFRDWGWPGDRSAWTRTYEYFDPFSEPYATLVYEHRTAEQRICRVEVFTQRPMDDANAVAPTDAAVGWVRAIRFPGDPDLPTLAETLAAEAQPMVLRYRPGKRCTIRFGAPTAPHFAKVYRDDRGARVHAESLALWQASGEGELRFAVAQPERWDAASHTLWQAAVPGAPLEQRLHEAGEPTLAYRIGQALASLARSSLAPQTVFDGTAQMARSIHRSAKLTAYVPGLSDAVGSLLDTLAELHAAGSSHGTRPIHGAPHAKQWLDDGTRLGLVDFDGLAWGDPELDAATLLAELDWSSQRTSAATATAFLAGYESIGKPLDRHLLAAYRAHRGLAKAIKAARSLRPDGDARAARRLTSVLTQAQGALR